MNLTIFTFRRIEQIGPRCLLSLFITSIGVHSIINWNLN